MGKPTDRIGYVDGLRAVAVLSVVVFHAAVFHRTAVPGPLVPILTNLRHGVDLFFVLSGFCLSYPTLAKLHRDGSTAFDVGRYASHRFVRIVPPYWLAIAVFVLSALALRGFGYALPATLQYGSAPVEVIKQMLFIDGDVQFLNQSFWTLPIEFRWYFLFPILLWVWSRSPKSFIALGGAAIVLTITKGSNINIIYLPAFMLGIVAADLHIRQIDLGKWPAIAMVALTAVTVATTQGWDDRFLPFPYLAMFAFVVMSGNSRSLRGLLSVRWLTAVGFASYSIYLVHQPIIEFAETHGTAPVIAAAIAIACGFAFWLVAERPFVETSLRVRLVGEFEQFFRKWLPRVGIARVIPLGGRHVLASGLRAKADPPLLDVAAGAAYNPD